jgi:hypothetical protein
MDMNKSFLVAACALSLAAVPALAQTSQGKGGAENGPTSNSVTTNDSGPRGGAGGGGTAATGTTHSGSGTVGAGTGSSAPSSSGNVGPGTNNNSGKQPGGR